MPARTTPTIAPSLPAAVNPVLSQALAAAASGAWNAHGARRRCPQCGSPRRAPTALAELEQFVNPPGPVLPEMLMQHLGHAAAEAEAEDEAEAFVGALIPLAARVVPRAGPTLMRAAPQLIRGVSRMTGELWRRPQTRRMVNAVPTVVTRTARVLAQRDRAGRVTTPQAAMRVLTRQAQRVLGDPRRRGQAIRRAVAVDRRYHEAVCPRTFTGGAPDPLRDRGRVGPLGTDDIGALPRLAPRAGRRL